MKRTCKTLAILLLVCGGAFAQERVETNEEIEVSSNSVPVATPPPAPKSAPAPVAPPAAVQRTEPEEKPAREFKPQVIVRPAFNPRDLENLLVPIVSVVVVFGTIVLVCALFFAFLHRRQRMLHETVRLMVEKGVSIPPELLAKPERKAPVRIRNDARRGWILTGVGVGMLCLAMFGGRHGLSGMGVLGFIPLFLGLAFLMISKVERKNKEVIES